MKLNQFVRSFGFDALVPMAFAVVLAPSSAWSRTQMIFTAVGANCENGLCVQGSFPRKTPITLISTETGETCEIKTGKKHLHPPISEIIGSKKCKRPLTDFDLGILEMQDTKFKVRKGTRLSEKEITELSGDFFKSTVFSAALKEKIYPQANKGKIPYTLADFKRQGIEGYNFKSKGEHIQVVRPKAFDGENAGPYYARIKERWSRVTSGFSVTGSEPVLFNLRNRIFFKTESTCQMACLTDKEEIYEFNGRNFRMIIHQEYTKPDLEAPH